MKKSYVALIDSGVGGLSVLKKLVNSFPCENYLYFGDNNNAPYGNKSLRELKKVVLENIIYLNNFNIKFLVVACNTLSTNLISFIKDVCPYPVYGIYPPIEIYLYRKEKIALVSTYKTSQQFKNQPIDIYSLSNLAQDIEDNIFSLNNVDLERHLLPQKKRYDRVILGCTHYFFIKSHFLDHFDHSKITCSEDFAPAFFLDKVKINKSLVNFKRNQILFVGKNRTNNKKVWRKVVKEL